MNVVLCFTVVLIHGVLAEFNREHESTTPTGSNLTNYTNEDYAPTRKSYSVTGDENENKSLSKILTARTETEDEKEDESGKNRTNQKLMQDPEFAQNEKTDVLKDNVIIEQNGVSTYNKNMSFTEFSSNTDNVSNSPLSFVAKFLSSSTQEKKNFSFKNTLGITDLSNLATTDGSSSNPTLSSTFANENPDDNWKVDSDVSEETESSRNLNDLSTSPLSDISSPYEKNIREKEETISSEISTLSRIFDDTSSSSALFTTTDTESSSQDSTAEKETFSSSSTNNEEISSTGVDSSTNPDYASISTHTSTRACEILPNVNFSKIEPYDFHVILEWESPDTLCSDIEYVVYLDNTEQNRTKNLTLTIEDLYACMAYTVSIAAAFQENLGVPSEPESFNTTFPDSFRSYGVQNLTLTKIFEGSLELTWEPPDKKVLECVTNYYLIWWDNAIPESSNTVTNITENSYTLPLIGCMQYGLMLYPQSGATHNGHEESLNYTAEPIPFNHTIVKFLYGKTHANITLEIDDNTKNRCNLTDIFVTCNAPSDQNSNTTWIITNADVYENITQQNTDYRYTTSIENLSPFTNYTCLSLVTNEAGNSTEIEFNFRTDEDVPSEPLDLKIIDIGPTNFTIQWQKPAKIPGIMEVYGLKIDNVGSLQNSTEQCSNNATNLHRNVSAEYTNYTFEGAIPYYTYSVSIYGIDGAGNGDEATNNALTASAEPDSVRNAHTEPPTYSENEIYHGTVSVTFEPPCNTYGPLKHYAVSYNGIRDGFDIVNDTITTNVTAAEVVLLPERTYSFSVTVVTENFSSLPVSISSIQSQAGVPILTRNMTPPTMMDTGKANFTLSKDVFSDENGKIIAYSLILTTTAPNSTYGLWNGSKENWPSLPENGRQLTPNFWNPFEDGVDSVVFIIGADGNCSGQNYCNQALNESTKYSLMVRALTSAGYKDSSLLHFETEMPDGVPDLALILGLIFGLLALLILTGFLIFLWRRRRRNATPEEEKRPSTNTHPAPIPVQKFVSYYASIKEDYNIVKQQFIDLGTESKEFSGEISFATLPENKRKNRYTNILPFDATRVSLKIDEDDEICSDYINASYIKGYTGKVEYIATQGPLESTARDFWKMILQENVTVIAMVSQFVEQSKEKCFHYFPNNHESIYFGESLEVKCSTELHFGTYCVRTLQVRKNSEQRDVVHMQFLEWPDFGAPQGTDNMLQFCGQLREKANKEGGLLAVHCSAGVGRTGTLIALDILLQTIDDHRDINIYKTVFDLRKQRTNMVQTEKQFMFIHTSIKDYIETPAIQSNDVGGERIYENMDMLRSSSLKKNLIESEIESAL